MLRVGVILSGCGVYDGAEIHEAVLTMLELDKRGCKLILMAPDKNQMHVVNHLTGEVSENETRNVLVESARIARGDIKNIDDVTEQELDALIIPGGFGAAKNLSNFAVKGADAEVDPGVIRILREMHKANKPIAAICIAPAVVAAAIGNIAPELTIGNDKNVASAIETMGGKHFECPVDSFHIDEKNKIITTPAYMLGKRISQVHKGIEKTVEALINLAN